MGCVQVENGVFHFMGRNDFQVKISGVRIECEEVRLNLAFGHGWVWELGFRAG